MWINPMLSIWLYMAIGGLIVHGIILWKFYGAEEFEKDNEEG